MQLINVSVQHPHKIVFVILFYCLVYKFFIVRRGSYVLLRLWPFWQQPNVLAIVKVENGEVTLVAALIQTADQKVSVAEIDRKTDFWIKVL